MGRGDEGGRGTGAGSGGRGVGGRGQGRGRGGRGGAGQGCRPRAHGRELLTFQLALGVEVCAKRLSAESSWSLASLVSGFFLPG